MELKDLIGLHELTAVDFGTEPASQPYDEAANYVLFTLDGTTYRVTEDASDGYRSSMRDIEVVADVAPLKNRFEPCKVLARIVDDPRRPASDNDLLQLIDVFTGKIVFEVGTVDTNDYYPAYVATFTPENMAVNAVAPNQ